MRNPKPWWLLLLMPLLPLWRAIFSGEAIGPWDHVRQYAPWFGSPPERPFDILQMDGTLQFYVWRDMVFESWSKFQIPLWNSYELAGTPLLANSQSAALYPPHILLGILHVPTALAITLLAWFHLALAGIGVYRLSRVFGASELGALLAGASFALCPFMVAWTALASVITTVAWIPWALAFTLEALPVDEKVLRRKLVGVALCVGMMFLGGHLQFAAYGCIALALVAASRFKAGPKPLGAWVLACVAGVVIASPQLIPVLQYGQFSHRRGEATEDGWNGYAASATLPWQFANFVNPMSLGDPREYPPETKIAGSGPPSSYWPAMIKRGDNFAESAVSPGPVVVALLCLLPFLWRRLRGAGGLVAVGVVGLLLAIGSPLAKLMYFGVPGWASTGSPGRAIVLFVMACCVVAGLIASELLDPETRPKRPTPVMGGALIFALIAAGTGLLANATASGIEDDALHQLAQRVSFGAGLTTLVIAAIAIQPILMGYFRSRGSGSMSSMGFLTAGVVVCAFLGGVERLILTAKPIERPKIEVGVHERVAFINNAWELLVAAPANMPPNLSALFRIHELGGYDSLMHKESVALLQEVDGQDSAPPANGNIQFVKPTTTPERLAEAGVTKVFSVLRSNAPSSQETDIAGPGRASTDHGPAEITAEDYHSVTVKATGPGMLTLRDRNMPGWTASIDGNSAPLREGRWMEVELTPGEHTVVFRYAPPNFLAYLVLSLLTLAGLGVAARKKTPAMAGAAEQVPGTEPESVSA